jgi:hypothetical protein
MNMLKMQKALRESQAALVSVQLSGGRQSTPPKPAVQARTASAMAALVTTTPAMAEQVMPTSATAVLVVPRR